MKLKVSVPCVADLCTSSPQTAEELESRNKLLRLLDSVIDALVWAISKLGLSTQQQTLRLGHLTMLLSHIRHVRYGGKRPHAHRRSLLLANISSSSSRCLKRRRDLCDSTCNV